MLRFIMIGILVVLSAFCAEGAIAQTALDRLEQRVRERLAPAPQDPESAVAADIGYLGIIVNDVADQGRGLRVTGLTEGGPSERDGIKPNDLITRINDRPVGTKAQFARAMQGYRPGTKVTFTLTRDGAEQQIAVTLGRRPGPDRGLPRGGLGEGQDPDAPLLGVKLSPITPELQTALNLPNTDGAFVSELVQGAPAERAGLPAGATILSVNGKPVRGPEDVERAVRGADPGSKLKLGYVAQGKESELEIELPAPPSEDALPEPSTSSRRGDADARWEALERRLDAIEQRLQAIEQRR